MGGGEAEPRQSHLIRRDEVDAWLADSAITQTTRHWTSAESARFIRENGVHVEQNNLDSAWGQGFYTTTASRPEWGDTPVRVAIRLRRPFLAVDRISALEEIDEMLSNARTEDVRAVLRAAGYDGLVVHWEAGEVWVIAFDNDQVKVVVEER